ncbi:MAG: toll/interleukin-1 receptor domain-containing protein [Deltaproteobacteria bacterium]|nr:toll/interleukin-1 receptor domain-containing protein [Deltaproteobacteria bacterium]
MTQPVSYKRWDLFISYASEDKEAVARPLAHILNDLGYKVWFDEFSLQIGDSLNEAVNEGLASSRYGLVIISPAFIAKRWPRNELNALFSLDETGNSILPIWHQVSAADVAEFNPVLADRVAMHTSQPITSIVAEIEVKIRPRDIAAEPAGVTGLWHGVSGRLVIEQAEQRLVGDYDWFGEPWVGQLSGDVENDLFRFSWSWRLDESRGYGFFLHTVVRADTRRVSFSHMLHGGWVYEENESILSSVIGQYKKQIVPIEEVHELLHDSENFPMGFGEPRIGQMEGFNPWVFSFSMFRRYGGARGLEPELGYGRKWTLG